MSIKYLYKTWNSLRTRIILSVLIMLLPASVLMLSSYNSIRGSLDSITDIVDTPLSRLVIAKKIQSKILRTELPFHLYLNRGEMADRESFIKLSIEIDILFDTIFKIDNLTNNAIELLKSSRDEWQLAKNLGEGLLTITNIPPNHILIEKADQFGRHLEISASMLDEVSELSFQQIKDIRFIAQDNEWKNIGALLLVYGLGMLLALLAALSLGQSIIEPIKTLQQNLTRFYEGNISSRMEVNSNDEIGNLAKTLNLISDRYEQIKNELNLLSTQDSLTGLFDRTKLDKEINMEIERAKRYDRAFSVLLININNFTEVNKTYGRLVGDSVLCSVANTIRNTIRPTDIAARYGGNEFAIVLSETDTLGSYETTQRIFEAIENEPLNIGDGNTLAISISIGYATYPTNADSNTELFSLTEKTISRSKFNKEMNAQLLQSNR